MNYGHARLTLSVALYRKWAAQSAKGRLQEASTTAEQARSLVEGAPDAVVRNACRTGPAVEAVERMVYVPRHDS